MRSCVMTPVSVNVFVRITLDFMYRCVAVEL